MITTEQWERIPPAVQQRLMNDPDTLDAASYRALRDAGSIEIASWFESAAGERAVYDTTIAARDFIRDRARDRDG